MEANEFVKKYGIDEAKRVLDYCEEQGIGLCVGSKTVSVNELKRLVESYYLVENATPEELYKASVQEGVWSNHKLKQAIDDMEELNEEEH